MRRPVRTRSGERAATAEHGAVADGARRARARRTWRRARRAAACRHGRRASVSHRRGREALQRWALADVGAGPAAALARRSRSASASFSISRPIVSRRSGRRCRSRLSLPRRHSGARTAGRVSAARSALAAVAAGFAIATLQDARVIAHPDPAARRPGTSRSRASSKCARSASAPTASWCASQRIEGAAARDAGARAALGDEAHGAAGRQRSSR